MTVANVPPEIAFAYTGPKEYDFPFKIFVTTDLIVEHVSSAGVVSVLTLGDDYTVEILAEPLVGGSITVTAPVTSGGSLTLYREVPYTQETSWDNTGPLDMTLLEAGFDRTVMLLQQMFQTVLTQGFRNQWRGEWAAGVDYSPGQMIISDAFDLYNCRVGHTSTGFSADFAAGYWSLVLDISDMVNNASDTYKVKRDSDGDTAVFVGALLDGIFATVSSLTAEAAAIRGEFEALAVPNLRTLGATGDGVANDTAAVLLAEAHDATHVYVPTGEYSTTLTFNQLTKTYFGPGRIVTFDSGTARTRANNVIRIGAAPSSLAPSGSIISEFDGSYASPLNYEYLVTGSGTAGTLSEGDGWVIHPQACPVFERAFYSSGDNLLPYNNSDRTGWAMHHMRLQHAGKGDGWAFFVNAQASASDAGVLGMQGAPATGALGGGITAADDDVVLQVFEFNMQDFGYDVRGHAATYDMQRTNATSAKGQFWSGVRLQSTGAEAVDVGYQMVGAFDVGLDASGADVTKAIALAAGQEIHFDATCGYVPACTTWAAGQSVTSGVDYRYYAQRVYIAASSGSTGVTPPTHTTGTVSDGAVDWTFVTANAFLSYATGFGGTKIYKSGSVLALVVGGTLAAAFGETSQTLYGDVFSTGNMRCTVNNSKSSGTASYRWTTTYLVTAPDVSSDERLKQDIRSLDEQEEQVALALKKLVKTYRLKSEVADGNAKRHTGLIAQDVRQAFFDAGLNPADYALFRDEGEYLSLVYEELLAFIIAAL